MIRGSIVQVSVSNGGLPKYPVSEGRIAPLGLEGDRQAHPQIHGGPRKAVLLVSSEVIEDLTSRGYALFRGAFGENLTVSGIDFREIRIGDRFRTGGALLEITQPRGPCAALDVYGPSIKDEIFDERVKAWDHASPRWGMSGLYAAVIEPGAVRPGDPISKEA
ncbi:MAG: MOSC domain-containing protein [Acidobacteriia bacterium]|nr:MOSC domain-containing protein [Terriglobia bacterium]